MAETRFFNKVEDGKQQSEKLVLDFQAISNPDRQHAIGQNSQIPDSKMEGTLKRIIAHLKEDDKRA
jgi:hypothetical protein